MYKSLHEDNFHPYSVHLLETNINKIVPIKPHVQARVSISYMTVHCKASSLPKKVTTGQHVIQVQDKKLHQSEIRLTQAEIK